MKHDIKSAAYFDEGFRELEDELEDVMGVLAEAIPVDSALLQQIPWIRRTGDEAPSPHEPKRAASAQLHSLAFELLNMVEEHVAYRFRSRRRRQHGAAAVSGLWPRLLREMSEAGCSEEETLAILAQVRVEPVLTAHPTEAKRPAVREKHLAIYRRLAEWEAVRADATRSDHMRSALRAEFESLWFTGEIFVERPRIENELRNAVYYLREVFPDVVVRLDRSLESAWAAQGWSLDRLRRAGAYPQVRFATWIGGDRDGHPLVTAEVTANCLAELRGHAARLHRRWLRDAADSLPLAPPFVANPTELVEAAEALAATFGDAGRSILQRNRNEPWRAWLYLLREKMGRTAEDGGYRRTSEYRADLERIHDSLLTARAVSSAQQFIRPLLRLADVFGFHLSALDVRQNSASHDEAFAILLAQAGITEGVDFANWPEPRRQEFLVRELANPRPLIAPGQELAEPAAKVIAPLRVLAGHIARSGAEGLGQLIVSMTRQPSDLLLVHILCREAGLASFQTGRWSAQLPVTPLFETGNDLAQSGTVLRRYFELAGNVPAVQPAMVGYSDSNKDAGVFASQWGVHRALEHITAACDEAGAAPQFFHGRGGTIGRGAGPIQWFLRALPPGSLRGPIRLTEQGEVLPRKYAHEGNAHYHLELLVAGVSAALGNATRAVPIDQDQRAALDHIAAKSTEAYDGLRHSDGFVDFFRAVTPIDALEAGTFGSRPPRRTGSQGHSLDDLRAIPWVFSWTQARFYLPGWFGVGSGLAALKRDHPSSHRKLREALPDLPFLRYVLTNVESSLASADREIMASYGALCTDGPLRTRMLAAIENELRLTTEQLAEFFGQEFSQRRPRLHHTLSLREEPLRHLHQQQVTLLQEWRAEESPLTNPSGAFHPLFLAVQLSINAIASGLRETG